MDRKGTKANPYLYDEYLLLCKNKKWLGGYVKLEDGRVDYYDKQEDYEPGTEGTGNGSESGSGSGEGCGSGTNDKPLYMVRAGKGKATAYDSAVGTFDINFSWSDGVAVSTSGGGCSNRDGFVSSISTTISFRISATVEEFLPVAIWSAPYTINLSASITYRIGEKTYSMRIDQLEYTVPGSYYETF